MQLEILKDEELTYDYGFAFDKDYKDFPCKCRSKKCVGYIIREGSDGEKTEVDIILANYNSVILLKNYLKYS